MVTIHVYKTKTTVEKIVGLIGKKQSEPLLLETRFGIHTFGVQFPIDVVILNDQHIVTALYEGMQPNRIFVWKPTSPLVLELPAGIIKKKKISKGTHIKLVLQ